MSGCRLDLHFPVRSDAGHLPYDCWSRELLFREVPVESAVHFSLGSVSFLIASENFCILCILTLLWLFMLQILTSGLRLASSFVMVFWMKKHS